MKIFRRIARRCGRQVRSESVKEEPNRRSPNFVSQVESKSVAGWNPLRMFHHEELDRTSLGLQFQAQLPCSARCQTVKRIAALIWLDIEADVIVSRNTVLFTTANRGAARVRRR